MKKWWIWTLGGATVCVVVILIVIHCWDITSEQNMKLKFDEYIEKFNKSYKSKSKEYETRFQHFKVSLNFVYMYIYLFTLCKKALCKHVYLVRLGQDLQV